MLLGAVLYCLSLNFKHMALYYAPAIFFYLLKGCLTPRTAGVTLWSAQGMLHALSSIAQLGGAVLLTFAALWWPYCAYADGHSCIQGLGQVLRRLFPLGRGLFEDKVRVTDCLELLAVLAM